MNSEQNDSRFDYRNHLDNIERWIDSERPNGFVTILLPTLRTPRPHSFYLSLWTRQAEAELWGSTALHVQNSKDRCLWIFRRETTCRTENRRQDNVHPSKSRTKKRRQRKAVLGDRLIHYHAALRMPDRLTLRERERGAPMSIAERCAEMRDALFRAREKTVARYAMFLRKRRSDFDVIPYDSIERKHTKYLLKEARPHVHDPLTERHHPKLLRDPELLIMPPARKRATRTNRKHR